MAYFPLFINLAGKRCACIGGGTVAARKVRLLIGFGAVVTVIDPFPCAELIALAEAETVRLIKCTYGGAGDLSGAALVIASTNDRALNERVSRDAQAKGVPVNVVDDPALCTFYFPAVVKRGELVAGISSSGGFPGLAAQLRARIEEEWPDNFASILIVLADIRTRVLLEVADPVLRKRILSKVMEAALDERVPKEETLLRENLYVLINKILDSAKNANRDEELNDDFFR